MPTTYRTFAFLWYYFVFGLSACEATTYKELETAANSVVTETASDSIPLLKTLLSDDSIHFYHQYDSVKNIIQKERSLFYQAYLNSNQKDSILLLAGGYLHQAIVQNILPFWYGTTWDFNGYTAVPRQGEIACGYLVSTTLKQSGVNINRYKLAQQASAVIVKNTCTQIQNIQGFPAFIKALSTLKDGLYVLGLDNHVGYISIENGTAYFLHSSFLSPGIACREPVSTSTVLLFSKIYVLGNFSHNKAMIKAWLTNQSLTIVP
jgi:hypothetical protein